MANFPVLRQFKILKLANARDVVRQFKIKNDRLVDGEAENTKFKLKIKDCPRLELLAVDYPGLRRVTLRDCSKLRQLFLTFCSDVRPNAGSKKDSETRFLKGP